MLISFVAYFFAYRQWYIEVTQLSAALLADELNGVLIMDYLTEWRSTAHYWLDDGHQLIRVLWDNEKEFLLQ